MQKPVIAVTRRFPPAVEERLRTHFTLILNEDDRPLASQDIPAFVKGATGVMISPTEKLTRDTIAALAPQIKIIASYSVGFDHIDIAAAREHGLVITNTPDVLTAATADIAILLMLGATRRAHEWQELLYSGKWARWVPGQLLGFDLQGARLGFVGMGRIAQATADRARVFGCKMQYWNRRKVDTPADVPFVENLDDLFKTSDIISLHVPGGAETQNIVNRERIALMPKGGVIINTARGSLIDDNALIEALQSGHLMAAGLDVFANEPNFDPRYRDLKNVFLLPHIGSATVGTRDAMGFRAVDNLIAYFNGESPRDRVA